jgi:hypothetical protein
VNTNVGELVVSAVAAMLIVLVVGDFASTFFYHVPQHVWGKLHLRTHHDRKRSYWDHAVLSKSPEILLDGFLGALPYMLIALACARLSVVGAIAGLMLGQLHVWWRHMCEVGWVTPRRFVRFARAIALVLPEDHNVHHQDPELEFGDIFRFYDAPARALIVRLRALSAWSLVTQLRAIPRRQRNAAALRTMRRLQRQRRQAGTLRTLKHRKSPTG